MEELLDNPERQLSSRKRIELRLVVSTVVLYILGTLALFYSIRIILFSGPAIATIGLIVIIVEVIQKEKIAIVFGSFGVMSVSGIAMIRFL